MDGSDGLAALAPQVGVQRPAEAAIVIRKSRQCGERSLRIAAREEQLAAAALEQPPVGVHELHAVSIMAVQTGL